MAHGTKGGARVEGGGGGVVLLYRDGGGQRGRWGEDDWGEDRAGSLGEGSSTSGMSTSGDDKYLREGADRMMAVEKDDRGWQRVMRR